MKNKPGRHKNITAPFIWFGFGFGIFFWILEAVIHTYIFHEDNIIKQILISDPHELWMRLVIAFLFILFGFFSQYIFNKVIHAEQSTGHIKKELDLIFNTSADGMRVVDKNFTVVQVNQAMADLLGMSKDEIVGKKCYEVFYGPPCRTARCPLRRARDGEERIECDMEKERRDGVKIPCLVTAVPFRGPDGQLLGIIEDFKDITRQKRTEEVLRKSEERFRNLVETISDWIWEVDENWVYTYVSPKIDNLLGHEAKEVIGKTPFDLMPKEEAERTAAVFGPIIAEHKPFMELENTNLHKDGRLVVLETSGTPVFDKEGSFRGYRGLDHDITARKRTEEELKKHRFHLEEIVKERTVELAAVNQNLEREISGRKRVEMALKESEERFRIAAENASDLIYEWNIEEGSLEWFGDVDEMLGYAPGEFSRTMEAREKILHTEDHDQVMAAVERHLKTRNPYFQEYRVVRKDGAILYWRDCGIALWDESGSPYKWIGVTTDITAQRRAEISLRESESFYRALFEDARDALFIIDSKHGIILDANRQAEILLKRQREEIIGLQQSKLYPPRKIEEYGKLFKRQTRIKSSQLEIAEIYTKDDRSVPVEINTNVIELSSGEKVIQAFFRDISERKKAEEEKEKMQGHLFDVQKLEAVGTLAGGIAHDFKNMLTAIIGNLSLIKLHLKPEDKIFEMLKEAEKSSQEANVLTQQLLIFSRGGAPVKKAASVSKLLKEAVPFALSGSGVRCELSVPEDLWCAEIDEGQINQVMNNVLINAVQAMTEGGIVKIGAENRMIRAVNGLPLENGRHIEISVKDQGGGIPEENLSHIFDPFFTTKPKGSGLGLAISYSIIKKHSGYITAESIPGTGTTFTIFLPALEKEIFAVEGMEERPVFGQGKILVMDDQPKIRNMVSQTLLFLGYEVGLALDGAEAVALYKKAKETGRPYDAVILDLTIPGGMGGVEAVQSLLKIDPEVKAIVSSGYSNDLILAEYKRYGFRGVIAKPYEIGELSKILDQVIKGTKGVYPGKESKI